MTDHSVSFEAVEDRTGTKYNIQFIAEHPLKIGTGAPDAGRILREIEVDLVQPSIGLIPIAAQCERMDEAWGTFESEGWMKRLPEALLIAVAKMLDGHREQMLDPDSPLFDQELSDEDTQPGCGQAYISAQDLAEHVVKLRREVNRT